MWRNVYRGPWLTVAGGVLGVLFYVAVSGWTWPAVLGDWLAALGALVLALLGGVMRAARGDERPTFAGLVLR